MSDILLRPIIAMQVAVHQLREREDGQTTTEYAILLGFLAIAIIIALFFLQERTAQPLLRRGQQRLEGSELEESLAARRQACGPPLGGPHAFPVVWDEPALSAGCTSRPLPGNPQ